MSEDELEELRKKRYLELQRRRTEQKEQMQQHLESQKQAILRTILTPEARQRLTNLKMVKPEFTSQLELQLIQLAQQGRLSIPLSDEQLKQILVQLQAQRRETRIRRK